MLILGAGWILPQSSKLASRGICLHGFTFESSSEVRVSGRDDVPLPYQSGGVDGGSLEDKVKGKGGWGRRGAPATAGNDGIAELMCVAEQTDALRGEGRSRRKIVTRGIKKRRVGCKPTRA